MLIFDFLLSLNHACLVFFFFQFHVFFQSKSVMEGLIYRRFHVDKMSSAHVYVRLHKGQTIDDISEGLLEDCAQLVKANSIQGKICSDSFFIYFYYILFSRICLFNLCGLASILPHQYRICHFTI